MSAIAKQSKAAGKKRSKSQEIWRRFKKNTRAVVGLGIVAVLVLCAVLAPILAPYGPNEQNPRNRLQGPSAEHWFGTDNVGRDLFTRVLYGARISVGIGVGATLLSLIIGAAIASVCALSKKADFVIMRVVDVVTCIPGILLALVLLAVLGGSVFNMVLTLTIVSVPGFVLHIRAVVLGVVEQDYVKAARISGTKPVKLVLKHILPNAIDPIIVDATMTISGMMLSAAGLSFIGVGVAPPAPEWGAMLTYAQQYMRTAPYMAIFPGLAIALTALSINLVGDGLRDALDPKSTK